MPLPSLLCLAFAAGLMAALAGRVELRVNPRPSLLTRSFGAFALFEFFVLIPISIYFYIFHGDWFLLYFWDVREIPSALALFGFMIEAAIGALGFLVGSSMVRHGRDSIALLFSLAGFGAAGLVAYVAKERLSVVGTFAQFRGGFGLEDFGAGPLLQGGIVMGALLLVALGSLLLRLRSSGRRSG